MYRAKKLFNLLLAVITAANTAVTISTIKQYEEIGTDNNVTTRIQMPEPAEVSPTAGVGRCMPSPQSDTLTATQPIKEPEETYELDVPLENELQSYIYELCTESDLPYTLVIALIERESSYRADVISKTDDWGLMQINSINHKTLADELGITDFLDPEQNCTAGIHMLSQYYRKYGDCHLALMAYNLGEKGAKRCWDKGIYSTSYSESIVEIMNRLEANA